MGRFKEFSACTHVVRCKPGAPRKRSLLSTLLVVVFTGGAAQGAGDQTTVRRFGLVVGVNDGGPGRGILRYAGRDAAVVAKVIGTLGGIEPADLVLLREPSPGELRSALERLRLRLERARRANVRPQVLFYYSGHSDETGLLVRGARVRYAELRQLIDTLPADVRVAVLDSCASGAMTRSKGGLRGPPFLRDLSTDVRGSAFLASASATEAAQESDRLRGSFFTHNLVTGLRGAADADRDRRVTLNEAYQYAFDQTLAQTESTRAGAQHPSYDVRLSGSGGLVLTDLRRESSLLTIGPDLRGQLYIRDRAGNLVAELRKRSGQPIGLALEPGLYNLRLTQGDRLLRGSFELKERAEARVGAAQLADVERLAFAERGPVNEWVPAHLISARYVGLAGSSLSETYFDPPYNNALPWRFQSELQQRYRHGAELRYLHRVGPLYLGVSGGYRRDRYTYSNTDGLVLGTLPFNLRERADAHSFYALASLEWHVPLWRKLRPYRLFRWIRPVLAADLGGGFIDERKESTRLETYHPPEGADDRPAVGLPLAHLPLLNEPPERSDRQLGAAYLRARLGFGVPVSSRLRVDVEGLLGLELSDRLKDNLGKRIEQVDPAPTVIGQLGFSAGITLAL